ISAYCGHPSTFLIEGLVMLGFLVCFGICVRLCAKLGW
ncbi:membrane protein, partial [Helicobacter pylori]